MRDHGRLSSGSRPRVSRADRTKAASRHLLNWGCIPAKALLESAALAHVSKSHGAEMGVNPIQVEYDFPAAVNRSRGITKKLTDGVQFLLKKNKIDIIQGRGRIAGPGWS